MATNDTPDYSSYTWEQLQDARAHINRELYPSQCAALQSEIETRQHGLSSLKAASSSALLPPNATAPRHSAASNGCIFWSWLGGGGIGGLILAPIQYANTTAHLRAIGDMSYQRDDAGFALIGLLLVDSFAGSLLGLILGLFLPLVVNRWRYARTHH